jgi:major membrane immunogen (membrane-anchored lipoprotein)
MYKCALASLSILAILTPAAFAGPKVTAPSNGATVQSSVHYAATAGSTSCSKGVASMGVYTAPGVLAYVTNGTSINTDISLSAGTYNTTVQQWDHCGGASTTPITITVTSSSGVFVTSPANNSNVTSPVHYAATATTTCSKGVASMGIYTAPYQKAYTVNGASLSTDLTLSPGTYNTTVEEWDKCGGAATKAVTITVTGGTTGKTFTSLQASKGWTGYGELPPKYDICSKCSGVTWSMTQNISSPSMDSKATKFFIGGTTPYADVLWNNHLIGDGSSQGMLDSNHTLVPTLHNFTYDAYFYGTNLSLAENIEFDIAQFVDDKGFMFGTQCQLQENGSIWSIWDPLHGKWVATSAPCKPTSNTWNHVTIKVQRTSSDQLLYQSITLNGVTTTLNKTYSPFSAPGWWGVVVNFQLDGNYNQSDYSVYLDKFNFTYY